MASLLYGYLEVVKYHQNPFLDYVINKFHNKQISPWKASLNFTCLWSLQLIMTSWYGNTLSIAGPFERGIHRSLLDSSHKRPIMLVGLWCFLLLLIHTKLLNKQSCCHDCNVRNMTTGWAKSPMIFNITLSKHGLNSFVKVTTEAWSRVC